MPRKKRVQYKNAWYHVINRGAGRRYILDNLNNNKESFLELLNEIYIKYSIETHAYCVMDNHYHLLIKTPNANLAIAMKYLQGMYARIYNAKIKSDGPIFKGRYKSFIIETDSYLIDVCRYIHRNPVEAKLKSGLSYKWSSFNNYLLNKDNPQWLKTSTIMSFFTGDEGRLLFHDYHLKENDAKLIEFYRKNAKNDFAVLKDNLKEVAIENTFEKLKQNKLISIENHLIKYFNITTNTLKNTNRGFINNYKNIFIFIAKNIYDYSSAEISEYLGYKQRNTVVKLNAKVKVKFCNNKIVSYRKIKHNVNCVIDKVAKDYFSL